MYHLISGRYVFPGESPIDRLGQRINGRPTPLGDLVPDLPAGLPEVMDRLLANKPKDRYQTAEEAAEALEALLPSKPRRSSRPARESIELGEESPFPQVRLDGPSEPAVGGILPEYPAWFEPIAGLAEQSPRGLLVLFLAMLLLSFGAGILTALLIRR